MHWDGVSASSFFNDELDFSNDEHLTNETLPAHTHSTHHRHTHACSSTPKSESGIIFEDGQTYEEVISEPYTADQVEDEEDHSDHDHE